MQNDPGGIVNYPACKLLKLFCVSGPCQMIDFSSPGITVHLLGCYGTPVGMLYVLCPSA